MLYRTLTPLAIVAALLSVPVAADARQAAVQVAAFEKALEHSPFDGAAHTAEGNAAQDRSRVSAAALNGVGHYASDRFWPITDT